jgi:DNA helicase-2/ATP-dependent DNA helicase PcrA
MSHEPRARRIDGLVDALNPEQRAAVVHRGGPVLVLAGAGTGKTRVITVRIAKLVADGVPPERILALTFTNKAAGEMAERVAHFLGREAAAAMTVGTFHSLGMQVVERDAKKLGFKRGLALIDAADQANATRQCLRGLRVDPRRHDPQVFLTAISNARNAGLTPADILARPGQHLLGRVFKSYLEWLRAYQVMDFDDLILRTNELFETHPEVLARWRDRFSAILVDEFQDTNLAQLTLVEHLAAEHRQLCVVGDDDQSIYGWRGADVRNILEFERTFPDATAIALTRNYRSTGHILAAANAVIGHNEARREKSLWTDVGDGELVRLVTCRDQEGEAHFVANEILRLRAVEGRAWREFGVLFRVSAQTRAIESAFRLLAIPFRVGSAYDFHERKEVKDILSYLRLGLHPEDEASLLRIINFPQRGIGPATIEAMHDAAHARHIGLWDVLCDLDALPSLTAPQRAALGRLVEVIRAVGRDIADNKRLDVLVTELCEVLGAREAWIRDPAEGPGGLTRWGNIERLVKSLAQWQDRNPGGALRDWLRLVALGTRDAGDEEEDAVPLMTLHAAKGLEWPVCFVIGCQEGIIPHQRTVDAPRGDIAEERRLFYVGITRARRLCYLTLGKVRRGLHGPEPQRPSRFLREIPDAHLERLERTREVEPATKEAAAARFAEIRARLAGQAAKPD